MKYSLYLFLMIGFVIGAYRMAQEKLDRPLNLNALRLGMTLEQVETTFGTPSAQGRNQYTYILQDGSELVITLRDDLVSSAKVKFHRIIKIQDPDMKKLTLVQMDSQAMDSNYPSWFFAGKPEEGLIYKITARGTVESLTWVPPFSYASHQPKRLSALLEDFQGQQVSNL